MNETKSQYKKKVVGNFNKGQKNGISSTGVRKTLINQPLSKSLMLEGDELRRISTYTSRKEEPINPINEEVNVQESIVKSIKLLLPTLDENGLNEIQLELNKLRKKK